MRAFLSDEGPDVLRLIRSENVGAATFWDLIARYGTARAALEAVPDLAVKAGRSRPVRVPGWREVEREIEAARSCGAHPVFYGAQNYPPALMTVHAPPPVIMVRGAVAALSTRQVAVVGARKASAAGRTMAARLSAEFVEAGLTVTSGLALGIDTAAHRAALETPAALATVAVVAGGVDVPTPHENAALADEIAERGALVSEMPMGWAPFARDFPRRNRLIAGLSEAVVVVEAAARSGSLYTARYAADAGREVFAVPGSPLDPRAEGCLSLLKNGAGLVTSAADVMVELAQPPVGFSAAESGFGPAPAIQAPTATLEAVAEALSVTPVALDDLTRGLGLPAGDVLAAVTELELAGRAERDEWGAVRTVA